MIISNESLVVTHMSILSGRQVYWIYTIPISIWWCVCVCHQKKLMSIPSPHHLRAPELHATEGAETDLGLDLHQTSGSFRITDKKNLWKNDRSSTKVRWGIWHKLYVHTNLTQIICLRKHWQTNITCSCFFGREYFFSSADIISFWTKKKVNWEDGSFWSVKSVFRAKMVFKQVGYHPKSTNIFPMIYEFLEDSTKSVLGACDEMHQRKVKSTNIPLQHSSVFWLFILFGVIGYGQVSQINMCCLSK